MSNEIVDALVDVGRQLHESGLNAGTAGNFSARLADGRVVMSKRRVRKATMASGDFIVFNPDHPGPEALEQASTEYKLHLASYRADDAVRAVLHAHSPALTAVGLRRGSFPQLLPELENVVGSIVINPFESSGSERLADDVGRAVGRGASVVILKRHGVVAVGMSVAQALDRLELAENGARTILLAER